MPHAALQFLGAAGTVTGSKFLVECGGTTVLVDCGLFQGPKPLRQRNWAPLPVDAGDISTVVLSHAHLDHVGYLPLLMRQGFSGRVVASEHTAQLAAVVLADSGRLQEEEAEYANHKGYSKHHPAKPLYTEAEAVAAAQRIEGIAVDTDIAVSPSATLRLARSGHILGSTTVSLTLHDVGQTLLFSGDLGRQGHPLLLPPEPAPDADVVVIESTYGARRHDDEAHATEALATVVRETVARGGAIVIPAFAVDRTEVVLYHLTNLARTGRIPRVPVYVDSPMALEVLRVYREAIAQRDPELRLDVLTAGSFDVEGELHEARSVDQSRALNSVRSGIIISSSGMATGGRVLHHLARRLPDRRSSVVLVGYQSAGTRGQLLRSGATTLKMLGQYVPVNAAVVNINGLSVHADSDELVQWLTGAGHVPRTTYVVHGEEDSANALRDRLQQLGHTAVVPALDERVRLI